MSPQDDFVFHDRLTHSLKVAQVAERLAAKLASDFLSSFASGSPRREAKRRLLLEPKVCYTAGLIHDLGHPPFGHAAEVTLQRVLEEIPSGEQTPLLPDSFEGNAQSFRIVSRLSFRKRETAGSDLTWRTLAALSKYPWNHSDPRSNMDGKKKWGYYATEIGFETELRRLNLIDPHGPQDVIRQSLEAQVMDWADDIAYAVHDLEDFYRTGRIPLDRLAHLTLQGEPTSEWTSVSANGIAKVRKSVTPAELSDQELHELIDEVRLNFVSSPFDGSRSSHEDLQLLSSTLIQTLSDECRVVDHAKSGKPMLEVSARGRAIAEFLKSLTQYFVIRDPALAMMQTGQVRVVEELFQILLESANKSYSDGKDADPNTLPLRFQAYAQEALTSADFSVYDGRKRQLARATVDFICGLTDRQASLLHQRLSGDSAGTMSSYWLKV